MKFDLFNKKKVAELEHKLEHKENDLHNLARDNQELKLKLEKIDKELDRLEEFKKIKFTGHRVISEKWGCQYRATLDFDLDEYRDHPMILRHVGENLIRMALSKCNQWEILRSK